MKYYIRYTVMGAASLLCLACNDFLDKEPISMLTPEHYLTTEANVASFIYTYYENSFPVHGQYEWGTFQLDNNTDNTAYVTPSDIFAPGYWRVPEFGGAYNSFGRLYHLNYFLEKVPELFRKGAITGSETAIKHCIGEIHFFRAYDYFSKLKTFGDMPIINTVLPDDLAKLTAESKRIPCNEVARFILSDLDKAIECMLDNPDGGTNRLSKDCARLFKSRVALYEGTWLKYFKNTAFVPNGPGWPGAQKDYNANYQYPTGSIDAEIDFFLTQAINEAQLIADKYPLTDNTGAFQNNPSDPSNPYYNMFADEDMSKYTEVLLWKQYNRSTGPTNTINQWAASSNCGYGTTKSMVDAFIMTNGKPIYAEGSGYAGDTNLRNITKDRDSRAQLFIKRPGDNNLHNAPQGPAYREEPYPNITAGTASDRYTTGYTLRKGMNFDGSQTAIGQSTIGSIVFRAAEAYLNYIEAYYEKTGQINATADKYWKALRKRAKINEDYNITITATNMDKESETDWGAYSGGQLINATLFNIRRERRCELMGENFRNDDIRRWRAMDQMITTPYHILGINLWENDNLSEYNGKLEENINVSPRSFNKYLAPYHIFSNNHVYNGYRWNMAHYLEPIAIQHFLITGEGDATASPLYQNPGWPLTPNEGAQ